jgi:hypothetical protein
MKKRQFTIIELLVAITLTVVIVNILSTMYVRLSQFAVQQSGILASYDNGTSALDLIGRDLGKLYLPTLPTDPLPVVTNEAYLLNGFADTTNSKLAAVTFAAVPPTANCGWPFFAFSINDWQEEVAFYCGPPASILSSTAGKVGGIDEQLLTVYRWTNPEVSKKFETYTYPSPFSRTDSGASVINNVIYMTPVFHQAAGGNVIAYESFLKSKRLLSRCC